MIRGRCRSTPHLGNIFDVISVFLDLARLLPRLNRTTLETHSTPYLSGECLVILRSLLPLGLPPLSFPPLPSLGKISGSKQTSELFLPLPLGQQVRLQFTVFQNLQSGFEVLMHPVSNQVTTLGRRKTFISKERRVGVINQTCDRY